MVGTIRVLCVDDNTDLAEVVCAAIGAEPDMESVGTLHSANDLRREVESRQPDVVLIDLTMPGENPLAAIADAARHCPKTRAIVMSGHDDPATIDAATDSGAWGFVSKNGDMERIFHAIRAVARGETAFGRQP
ncbi:MAG TPA: response regulator transcription factor [Phycisphaerales bacterium]|nr:response regulator transcription factor [Phycisphaerales bacterium]